MPIPTGGYRRLVVPADADGNTVGIVFDAANNIYRLAVETILKASEIEIGHVVLKNDATEDHATIADDNQLVNAAYPLEGLAIIGHDAANNRWKILRTDAGGNLMIGGGTAALNKVTMQAPISVTVGTISASILAADANRKFLSLSVTTSGGIVSFAFGAAAVLNAGLTLVGPSTVVFGSDGITTQEVFAIADAAGRNVGIQQGV